ncbi:hypothetical protein M011DRAFT_393323 [Sporormia fimetaria CBS 119925]|uniref:Helix-turn-helix domain-containing protein n=1 Tax=Sporormia fimetaria CBS 119925 TaxID=1340428 RepID=A0A6A6VRU9_9PLEO|nr:hypothetical protein M011DRAFT_393323 [Sporormia fimetaria CBS 119925]
MGSSASKGARTAGSGARQYPTRVPHAQRPTTTSPNVTSPQPRRRSPPELAVPVQGQDVQGMANGLDGRDPGLASRLDKIGPVQTHPQWSLLPTADLRQNLPPDVPADIMQPLPPSAFPNLADNPALRVLEARQRIQEEAEQELEQMNRRGFEVRKYVDASILQLALMRRKRGEPDSRIEESFNLEKGRLSAIPKHITEAIPEA